MINEVRIISNCANEVNVISEIEISERLYQRLVTKAKEITKDVKKHIPLIVGLTADVNRTPDVHISALAIRVPTQKNTLDNIVHLAAAIKTTHEILLKNLSLDIQLDNINTDLKEFQDE